MTPLNSDFSLFPLSGFQNDEGDSTGSHSLKLFYWTPSDETRIPGRLREKQPPQVPDYKNALNWAREWEVPRGSFILSRDSASDNANSDTDQEAIDRLTLLSRKYATETVQFTKEDNARLEMLNQKVDLRYTRFTAQDWELLDEAKSLVEELSKI